MSAPNPNPQAHDPQRSPRGRRKRPPLLPHVCAPACLSLLLLLVSLPLVLRLNRADFSAATGHTETPYLVRWVLVSAALFLLSGLVYAWRSRPRSLTS